LGNQKPVATFNGAQITGPANFLRPWKLDSQGLPFARVRETLQKAAFTFHESEMCIRVLVNPHIPQKYLHVVPTIFELVTPAMESET